MFNSIAFTTCFFFSSLRKLQRILRRNADERNDEDNRLLSESPLLLEELQKRVNQRTLQKERCMEIEDPSELLDYKCNLLVKAIRESKYTIVYTGAGISTSAEIPDYRGQNGLWTQLAGCGTTEPVKDLALAGTQIFLVSPQSSE